MSRREALLVALLALFAGGVSLAIASAALERIPHVTDGVSYSFQARLFASGRMWLDPPALPQLFAHENVVLNEDRWCALYPPGWPLLLAIGWMVGAPWVLGPLMLALAVVGVWHLGRGLFDPRTGLLAAAALAVSPFALLMGAGDLAHAPALCATVWCLSFLVRGNLLVAGLLGGFAFLVRPSTAVALLAPAVAWSLRRDWRRGLARLALGALPCAAAFLIYHWIVFGHPLTTGYQAYDADLFTRADRATLPLAAALTERLPWYLAGLSRSLWGFPFPDLLILLPLLVPRPGRSKDLMLAVCAVSLLVGHSFYYYADVIYSGPRFVFEALGPLAVLAARALLTIRVPRLAAALGAVALLAFPLGRRLPEQVVHHGRWYLAQSAEPLRRMAEAGVGPDALVFVSGTPFVYSSFFLENALPPGEGRRVFVRDIPPLREEAMRVYGRREVWQVWIDLEIPPAQPDIAVPREISWRRIR